MRHARTMLTWQQFSVVRPDLARVGAEFLYGHASRIGLGFLATTRVDGGPRVHPICPFLSEQGLYAFVVQGPKLEDLRRDGRYALHSETFPPPDHDDAFYLTGRASEPDDPALRAVLAQRFFAEREMSEPWPGFDDEVLIELGIERCLVTITRPRDGFAAGHTVWHA